MDETMALEKATTKEAYDQHSDEVDKPLTRTIIIARFFPLCWTLFFLLSMFLH